MRAGDNTKVRSVKPGEDATSRIQRVVNERRPFEREGFSMYEAINPKMRVDDKSKWKVASGFCKD